MKSKYAEMYRLLVDIEVLISIRFFKIIYQVNPRCVTPNPEHLELPWVGMQRGKHAGCTLSSPS